MKKISMAVIFSLVLCLLTACGGKEGQTETKADETAAETTTEEVTLPEPDTSAVPIYEEFGFTLPDYKSKAILRETDPMTDEYMDSIVYLCDSTSYHMGPRGLVAREQIWTGPEGTQTLAYQSTYEILDPYDGVERPIREVARLHTPERMIIILGTNGINFMSEQEVHDEFIDLILGIRDASPETDIILGSIYPMTPDMYSWSTARFDNNTITAANAQILKAAEETGCGYLDIFSALIDEDGYAKDELFTDGLHPNKEGNQLILDYIRTHGHPVEKEVPTTDFSDAK